MLASFFDELSKIAAAKESFGVSYSSNVTAKPASVSIGPRKISTSPKTEAKPTNYTMVHSQQPEAAYGSSAGVKSIPPPPVRT